MRVFIIGVEGSGTTMLSRILDGIPSFISLHGNYISDKAKHSKSTSDLVYELIHLTNQLWDTSGEINEYRDAQTKIPILLESLESEVNKLGDYDKFIYKRSSPFMKGNRYIPDPLDVYQLFGEKTKIIVMHRDPKESSYSALRRGFLKDIKHCAVTCHINLSLLSSLVPSLNSPLVINYNKFCKSPLDFHEILADYLDVSESSVRKSFEEENVKSRGTDKYKTEMSKEQLEFLNKYFNEKRMSTYKFTNK